MLEPSKPPAWRRYLRFWRANAPGDLDAELGFHIEARTDELIASGMDAGPARDAALREFGDVTRVRGEVNAMDERHERRSHVRELLADGLADVRYAVRSLRQSPGFAVVVIVTLMLGIALNGTIFSLVNAYLFKPLKVAHAERLVVMGVTDPAIAFPHEMSYPDFRDYRELDSVFAGLAGSVFITASLNETGRTERVFVETTTGAYFQTLQPPMLLGRTYGTAESGAAARVVVLGHAFWQRRFAGDSTIVGRTMRLNGDAYTVLGVAAPGFHGFTPMVAAAAWVPIDESADALRGRLSKRDDGWLNVIGRLRDGVSVERARAVVQARAAQLQKDYPVTNKGVQAVLVAETRSRPMLAISGPVPGVAAVMIGLTILILIIVCANVANLLLARATVRQREHAVRAALGASSWRLARLALAEVAILALLGAGAAFVLARWVALRLSNLRVATDAPVHLDFAADWRVFAFTLASALAATLLAGLLPALRSAQVDPQSALAAGGRSATDRSHQRLRGALVVAQVAISVLVLVAAGLFAQSMRATKSMDLGFPTTNILTGAVDLSLSRYDTLKAKEFQRELLERLKASPGVQGVAFSTNLPFGYNNQTWRVETDVRATDVPEGGLAIFNSIVTPGYFKTAGPAIVRGREFSAADDEHAPSIAVVNEAMARRLWPNADPLGKRFRSPDVEKEFVVVGIARDAQYMFLGEAPRPFFWVPLAQRPSMGVIIHLAATSNAAALELPLRQVVRELDPDVPIFELRTMDDHLWNGRALMSVKLGALFGSVLAFLALALAAVGVYGVISYSVSHRTREIGIRMALGARIGNVMRLIVGQGMRLALVGVGVGALLAIVVGRVMASVLYGVVPHDPLAFGGAVVVLTAVAAIASWLPARRAAKLDPVRALRTG